MIQSVSQAVGRSVSPSHIYMYKQSVLELHIEGEREMWFGGGKR